ncbi:8-oxo-dGTP diphosphatase MutT [Cohnella suwonensis]|uniref:8-oxo-dGTP diphosphatase n=1 Tax=Cohnella suwonensis TaxID=696072 RepID=A0ABW0M0G3_9BACL
MIEVAAAIIENDQGQILIARRKKGKSQEGMWEFPGGKLEPGESPETCLIRELQEEMGIEIIPYEWFGNNEHDYGTVQIKLIAYMAKYSQGEIKLTDHDEYRWAGRSELSEYDWAPADIPFVERLLSLRHPIPRESLGS